MFENMFSNPFAQQHPSAASAVQKGLYSGARESGTTLPSGPSPEQMDMMQKQQEAQQMSNTLRAGTAAMTKPAGTRMGRHYVPPSGADYLTTGLQPVLASMVKPEPRIDPRMYSNMDPSMYTGMFRGMGG